MFSVRRFGKGTKKLALTNHGQWIEDYVFDFAPVGVLVVDRGTLSGTVGKTRIHLAR